MSDRNYQVLFVCTGNSARSIIAEAILNRMGRGRFQAYSAGSTPKAEVHAQTLALLRQLKYPTDQARSKDWQEFAGPASPQLDFVFTLCDSAASEVCPVWPGQPMTAHWGIPDPSAVTGTDARIRAAFFDTYRILDRRLSIFTNLRLDGLERLTLQQRLRDIGDNT